MSKNVSKIDSKQCYGCNACYNKCPHNAIEMKENEEGFKQPFINEKKCTNCGLCLQVCPVLKLQKNNKYNQKYYVGFNKDMQARAESSSGGIFTLFANWVLENNGYISGACFDENARLRHILTNKKEDLKQLRGSKYLQSEIGFLYREIKEKLKENVPVLFCGTPCQVNGLLNYLGKEYDNLYTLDIVCHGVPSQKSFSEYLEEKFGKNQKYSFINFRDKRNGYYFPSFVVRDMNGTEIVCTDFSDPYLKAFSKNLFLRHRCGTCQFTTQERVGDITLADFWTVKEACPEVYYENGISSFVINSKKGEKLFNIIKSEFSYLKKVDYKTIKQHCFEAPLPTHKNRELYFSLKEMPFSKKIEKCLNEKNVGIINFSDENKNYGALFVAYSMKKVIEKLGYNAFNINYIRESQIKTDSKFDDFRSKYLNMTKPCYSMADLSNIQGQFSHIVTGGDQVFNGFLPEYTLQFVEGNINIFSYAASMGPSNISYFLKNKKEIQEILNRFDSIGVREDSGVRILKDLEINSQSHIDSVLLLDSSEYDEIIKNSNDIVKKDKKYIACMLWDFDDIKRLPLYEELSKEYEFVNVLGDGSDTLSFGQFLSLIKNASFTMVNSFHGIVFSILFKKQFVATRLNDMRDDRIITMFTKLGIKQNRLFYDISHITKDIFEEKIDYSLVEKNLAVERKKSLDFLKNALEAKPKTKYKMSSTGAKTVTKMKIFGKIVFLKCIKKNKKIKVLLFGFLPILQVKLAKGQVRLFGCIPLLKY